MQIQLNHKQEKVMRTALEFGKYVTTTKIAAEARVSWNTADKYLHEFAKNRWINRLAQGNRDYWKAVPAK